MTRDPAPVCECTHRRDEHNTAWATGGLQCRKCDRDWRHTYTPNHLAGGTTCTRDHCPATDTLNALHDLVTELYERSASCAQHCHARRIADRIIAVLDQPGG